MLSTLSVVGQTLFNFISPVLTSRQLNGHTRRHHGSYAGSFKLGQYASTVSLYVQFLVGHVRRIGGHLTHRAPLYIWHVEMMVIDTVLAYQACSLPGIPQGRSLIDDDDDDGDG